MKKMIKKVISGINYKAAATSAAVASVLTPMSVKAAPAFSEYNSGTLTGTSVVKGMANFFSIIGTYGGALYLIGSIFALVLAVRNEDTEGRNKAILNMLAAIALLSVGGVITLFGIQTS